ncbi:MAG: hypothetical protein GY791_15470 [Alphaproteobacteria bacterium]|nr:hypothetical protein [Alphaproteobacteria bacterium]
MRVVLILVALMLATSGAARGDPDSPPDQSFDIVREGSTIGLRTTRFQHDGDDLVVETETQIKVKIAFVTVYKRSEHQREVWRDGQLIDFTSSVDDDGDKYRVTASRQANGLEVQGETGAYIAPEGTLPLTMWNPATATAANLIDIKRGGLLEVATEPKGSEQLNVNGIGVSAARHAMTGDEEIDLWYDADGNMVLVRTEARDGSMIEIRRRPGD